LYCENTSYLIPGLSKEFSEKYVNKIEIWTEVEAILFKTKFS